MADKATTSKASAAPPADPQPTPAPARAPSAAVPQPAPVVAASTPLPAGLPRSFVSGGTTLEVQANGDIVFLQAGARVSIPAHDWAVLYANVQAEGSLTPSAIEAQRQAAVAADRERQRLVEKARDNPNGPEARQLAALTKP